MNPEQVTLAKLKAKIRTGFYSRLAVRTDISRQKTRQGRHGRDSTAYDLAKLMRELGARVQVGVEVIGKAGKHR